MVQLVLILDNIRSAANVGSLLRTADAVGSTRVIACGITPYPQLDQSKYDSRDPVVIARNHRAIAKTSLGAEASVKVEHISDTLTAIAQCRLEGRTIYGLEQTDGARDLFAIAPLTPAALVIGNEVDGVSASAINACDEVLEIPQAGAKESLNVAVAAGIAMYHITLKSRR